MLLWWRKLRAAHSLRSWFETTWLQYSLSAQPVDNTVKGFSFGSYRGYGSEGETIAFNTPGHICPHPSVRLTRWIRRGRVISYEIDICYNGPLVTQVHIPMKGTVSCRNLNGPHHTPRVSMLNPRSCGPVLTHLDFTLRHCHIVPCRHLRLVASP
jgi:hypothetical protein